MSAFSALLTGSTPVANVATNSCMTSQQVPEPRRTSKTDIVIMVQIDLEHRDFVEVGFGVVIDPLDQVLTTSVIDSISHRARRVQGCENTAESERSNQEGLSAGHRARTPVGDRRGWSWFETKDEKRFDSRVQIHPQGSRAKRRARRLARWAHPILCSLLPLHAGF